MVVSTYQSVSGAGKEAMDELFSQTRAVFVSDPVEAKKFPKRIAFNVIPQIDVFMDDGSTKEEWKMVVETKKILDPKIKLTATCVRVPVFIGHSEAVNIEFEKPITADEARDILRDAPGCLVIDRREPGGYITPHEAAGEDATYISRIREDPTVENGLTLWCVSDNLRKGAALNAVQIAEVLDQPRLAEAEAEGRLTPSRGRCGRPRSNSWSRGGRAPGEAAFAGAGDGQSAAAAAALASPASFLLGCVATFSPLNRFPYGASIGSSPPDLAAHLPGRHGVVPDPGRLRRPHPLQADLCCVFAPIPG